MIKSRILDDLTYKLLHTGHFIIEKSCLKANKDDFIKIRPIISFPHSYVITINYLFFTACVVRKWDLYVEFFTTIEKSLFYVMKKSTGISPKCQLIWVSLTTSVFHTWLRTEKEQNLQTKGPKATCFRYPFDKKS